MVRQAWNFWKLSVTAGSGVSMSRQLLALATASTCFCMIWHVVCKHEINGSMAAICGTLFATLGSIWGIGKINRSKDGQ